MIDAIRMILGALLAGFYFFAYAIMIFDAIRKNSIDEELES